MEDVLAVYTRPRDPDRPVVCLDETSKQLIAETRAPVAMQPGRPARIDYEYTRNGTANMFMMFAPLEGWRNVEVTDRRTAIDYAHVLKDLADVYFAQAETIVLIQDNLNTHAAYAEFRRLRAQMRRTARTPVGLNSMRLVETLKNYSERGMDYVQTIKTIIRVNNLREFDGAKLSENAVPAFTRSG